MASTCWWPAGTSRCRPPSGGPAAGAPRGGGRARAGGRRPRAGVGRRRGDQRRGRLGGGPGRRHAPAPVRGAGRAWCARGAEPGTRWGRGRRRPARSDIATRYGARGMSSVEQFEQVPVSGRVRTADGGSIPGAAVTLADMSGRQVAVAQTDTAGQYTLAAPGAGSYLVIVSAPGHQPAASVLTAPGAGTSHDIVLRGGSGLTGTVRAGGSGQPVGNATVTVANTRGEIAGAVTTGSDGTYRLSQLAEGQYTLVVAAAAYAPLAEQVTVEEGELARHDVELPASGRVVGTVLTADGDQPFPGAEVTLTNEVGTEIAAATVGQDGSFALSDVPPGRYTLVAGGYRPGVASLPAGNGRTRQADITLTLPE